MTSQPASGSCLCGGVTYRVSGPLRPVVFCHCRQCRRTSGHFVAATAAKTDDFELRAHQHLSWFRSSPHAQRGFCGRCGASLFWQPDHQQYISIMAGSLDQPTGLSASAHIFLEDAGDYYQLGDQLPQHQDGYGGIELSPEPLA